MRILCIGLDGRVGDPERGGHAVRWTREMARLVDDYVVLAESPDGRDSGPIPLEHNASAWLLGGSPAAYPFRAARLALRLHAASPFDLCTTEDPIRAGLAGALFAARAHVPLNVENHSLHINEPVWLRERPHHRIYNRIAISVVRRADSIRNYSPDQDDALIRVGVRRNRIYVAPPPFHACPSVDRGEARARFDLGESEAVVLSAGRMVSYKNLGTLIDAFAALRGSRKARLLLAGDGPARAAWRERARATGLNGSIRWLDALPEDDMPALYHACDAFVAPALHETGPRTVLEALSCDRPVVATPRMGVVHAGVCVHGESALVVPPNDASGMADALEMLLADSRWARRLAMEGHARAADICSVRAIARSVAGMYRETVHRARSEERLAAASAPLG
ncbi:MAG TPA: glycosyltransferase [Armatimonadota bacterium]